MNTKECKELLNNGLLQAFADGKDIEWRYSPDHDWLVGQNLSFDLGVSNYRIKQATIPHIFVTAIRAIASHGFFLKNPATTRTFKPLRNCSIPLHSCNW